MVNVELPYSDEHYTEEKIDCSTEDVQFTESNDNVHAVASSRGVERIALPDRINNFNDQEIESFIRDVVLEMAQQGKRVSLAPKRMADGIAIDWIYDVSVQSQSPESIVRGLPLDITKNALHPAYVSGERGSGKSSGNPIIIDDVEPGTSSHSPLPVFPNDHHNHRSLSEGSFYRYNGGNRHGLDSLKRKYSSPETFLILRNLSLEVDETKLRQILAERGIPESTISGIRLRTDGNNITAMVDITYDFALPDVKQRPGTTPDSRSTQSLPRMSPASTLGISSPTAGSGNEIVSGLAAANEHEREVIDLVSDGSEVDLDGEDDSKSVGRSHQSTAHDLNPLASPALSYVTLNATKDEEASTPANLLEGDSADTYNPRNIPSETSDSSSDEESHDEDSTEDRYEPPVPLPPRATEEEDLAQRMLHGPIDTVNDFLARETGRSAVCTWAPGDAPEPAGIDIISDGRSTLQHRPDVRSQLDMRHTNSSRGKHCDNQLSLKDSPARPEANTDLTICVPKTAYAKGRRLLVPSDETLPITVVYMRGDLQFIDQNRRVRLSRFSLPVEDEDANARHVVDAQLLNQDVIVVGYNEGRTQVSCVALGEDLRPKRHDLSHRAHSTVHEHRRTGTSSQNRGISSMCVLHENPYRFLSGGEDGTIRLWSVTHNAGEFSATSARLGIQHSQQVHCIAHRASDRRVFSGYSQYIHSADFEASNSRLSDTILLSSKPQQIHIHPQNPYIVILEVDHRDRQVQVYDTRKSTFRAAPCIQFGYETAKSYENTRRVYRYFKGSTVHSLFARGYQNGVACVWDYRKPQAVLERFQQQRRDPIEHAVLQDSGTLIAYGGHTVTFWSLNGT